MPDWQLGLPIPTEHRTFCGKGIAKRNKPTEYIVIDLNTSITNRKPMDKEEMKSFILQLIVSQLGSKQAYV